MRKQSTSIIYSYLFFFFPFVIFGQSAKGELPLPSDSLAAIQILNKADDLRKGGEKEEAIEHYKIVADYFYANNDWSRFVKCLSNIGISYRPLKDPEKSKNFIDSAYQVGMEKLGEFHKETIAAVYYYGVHHQQLNDFPTSIPFLEKAYDLWVQNENGSIYDLALCQAQIGFSYFNQSKLEESLPYFFKAIEIGSKDLNNNRSIVGNCYDFIGSYERKFGNYNEAINMYKKGQQILDPNAANYPLHAISSHSNISFTYLKIGDTENALIHAKKLREITENHFGADHPRMGGVFERMGNVYFGMNEYNTAIEMYEKALAVNKKRAKGKPFHADGFIYTNLGRIYMDLNDFNKAAIHLKKGIWIKEQVYGKTNTRVANTLANLGGVLGRNKKFEDAESTFLKAIVIYRINNEINHPDAAIVYEDLAELYDVKGEYEKALIYVDTSLYNFLGKYLNEEKKKKHVPHLRTFSAIALKGAILLEVYKKEKKEEDLLAAYEAYESGIRLLDSRLKESYRSGTQTNLIEFALPMLQGGVNVSSLLYKHTHELKYLEASFNWMEKTKAFLLKQSYNEKSIDDLVGVPKEKLEEKNNCFNKLNYYSNALLEEESKEHPDKEKMGLFLDKKFDYKNKYDTILIRLKNDYPIYNELKSKVVNVSIAELKKELKKEEQLIEYLLTHKYLFIFYANADFQTIIRHEIDSSFFENLDTFVALAKNPSTNNWKNNFEQFAKIGHQLYNELIPVSIRDELAGRKKLLIIPDGILNYLPFNILLTKNKNEKQTYRGLPYLINDFDLRYEYSADFLVNEKKVYGTGFWPGLFDNKPAYYGFAPFYGEGGALAFRGEADSKKMYGLFPFLERGGLLPLKFNIAEVDTAAQITGGVSFLGNRATLNSFYKTANDADILHLAMHALTNDEKPLFSQLVFEKKSTKNGKAEYGRLHSYDIHNLNLKAELALLSACSTGTGKIQKGEGVISLSRAFKYAGVSNVIMSQWTASDKPTQEIVIGFFKNLKNGMGKSEALCKSQRNYLNNASQKYAHPYFWSTLMLVGDSEPMYETIRTWPFIVIGFVFLIFLIGRRKNKRKNIAD